MLELPEEYREAINNASKKLVDTAKIVMFVAEMLGNDTFELDSPDGYNIKIKKNKE